MSKIYKLAKLRNQISEIWTQSKRFKLCLYHFESRDQKSLANLFNHQLSLFLFACKGVRINFLDNVFINGQTMQILDEDNLGTAELEK